MIDTDGYRPNVGIIITNGNGQLMWARRYGQNSWQFPQGGINQDETPEEAMYRELYEEVGLTSKHVKILAVSKVWLRYKLPKRMIRWDSKPLCIGQKQRWFLLELIAEDESINMITNAKPEFDGFKWVTFWYPIRQVVSFKRDVYRRALKEFSPIVLAQQNNKSIQPFVSKMYTFDKSKVKKIISADKRFTGEKSAQDDNSTQHHKEHSAFDKSNKIPSANSLNSHPENSERQSDIKSHLSEVMVISPDKEKKHQSKKKRRWPNKISTKSNKHYENKNKKNAK